MSMFTGHTVQELGADSTKQYRLPPEYTFWTTLSDERNYSTGVFSENPNLTQLPNGLNSAFETVCGPQDLVFPDALDPREFYEEGTPKLDQWLKACLNNEETLKSLVNGPGAYLRSKTPPQIMEIFGQSTTAADYVDEFLKWQADSDGSWAACLNLMDAHEPYHLQSRHDHWGGARLREYYDGFEDTTWAFYSGEEEWWWREAFESLYDGTIHQMDRQIQRLVNALRSRGELDETLLIVTSDHGECFGEYSPLMNTRLAEHGIGLPEELLHVPLLVRPPGGAEGRTIDELASLTALNDVVMESTAGAEFTPDMFVPEGPVVATSIVPEDAIAPFAEARGVDPSRFSGTSHVVYRGQSNYTMKYSSWGEENLVQEIFDPWTVRNLNRNNQTEVDQVFRSLSSRSLLEWGDTLDEIDGETERRLEDLGYL